MAIRVVSTRRESDEACAAFMFKKRECSLFPNKELKSEKELFQELLENILVVCKSDFFS